MIEYMSYKKLREQYRKCNFFPILELFMWRLSYDKKKTKIAVVTNPHSEDFQNYNKLKWSTHDVDIFEPTMVALEHFVPRIPKGGIIAFDELNAEGYPGETVAVLQKLGINNLRIQRLVFGTQISYVVIE